MKKSVKDQTTRAFQTGGYNPPVVPQPTQPYSQPTQVDPRTGTYTLPGTGIAGYQVPSGGQTGYTPYGGATPYFQPVQFTGAQYQTALQTTNLPTFAETVGSKPGQYDELRTYINDAGQTLQIPFKDGRPIYPIPEGYRPIGDQPAPVEEQTTVAPTVGKTTVRNEGGGDKEVGVSGTGYKGLSTTRGTGKGGLSAAAEQARTDLGITGYAGIPGGGTLGAIANAFGFEVPSAFGTAPLEGMTGTLSQGQLASIANMNPIEAKNAGIGMTPDVAKAVMDAQSNYGVTLTGVFGYKPGDINPTTGTAVGNHGMTVDSAFVGNAGTPPGAAYSSFSSMVATVTRGLETGWRGGFVSRTTYDNHMTEEQRNSYDNFDSRHKSNIEFEDAVSESATTGESYSGGPESMADAVADDRDPTGTAGAFTGQPTGMADEYDGPASDSTPSSGGFGAGQDSRGDDSDTGRGSGGTGQGSSSDGSAGGPGSGTDGGASSGCFEKGTLFKMADGTSKCVEDIKPGDKMYKGGLVYAVMQGDGLLEDWYDYKGIHVTSAHPVLDNGTWRRVGETSSKKAIDKREIYYSLMNTNHLMIAENGTEFTDFVEISADIGGRGEWMMEMLNQKQAA